MTKRCDPMSVPQAPPESARPDVHLELAVQRILMEYGRACDTRDARALEQLFAAHARASYGSDWIRGAPAIASWFCERTADVAHSQHLIGGARILTQERQVVEADAPLVAHQVFRASPNQVRMTTGTYRIRLSHDGDGDWRIVELALALGTKSTIPLEVG